MVDSAIPVRFPILGVGVDVQPFARAVETLCTWAHDPDQRRYVCTATVYSIMICREDPRIARAFAECAMVTADGMPLVWSQRRAGFRSADRVYGPDLMLAICDHARSVRHTFFGGLPGIADKLAERLGSRFPGLNVADCCTPARITIGDPLDHTLIDRLNRAAPDILWVGLGSPKQDWWMHAYRPHLNAHLIIGVGAAFDFLSGTKPQAPRWVQRSGFEWLFRLAHEPRRLGRRYIVYNGRFIAALFAERFTRRG